MRCLEVIATKEILLNADWLNLFNEVEKYQRNFIFEIVFDDSNIEFYLHTEKDLSPLAADIESFFLQPSARMLEYPRVITLRFVSKMYKNLISFREEQEIKKDEIIKRVLIRCGRHLGLRIFEVVHIFDSADGKRISAFYTPNNPFQSLELNFKENVKIRKNSLPLFLKTEEVSHLFQESQGILDISNYPYHTAPKHISLNNFDFDKHSLVVGQTGVGKSKFLEAFIKDVGNVSSEDYRVVIIDPHATLFNDLDSLNLAKKDINFTDSSCDLFPSSSEPKISTELTILLLKTLLGEQFNAKLERTLKYVLFVLFLTSKTSISNIKNFVTDTQFRKEILAELPSEFDYLIQFFDTEFIELMTKYYEVAIMPILTLIDELTFLPALTGDNQTDLEQTIQDNFITCFSLNKVFLGEKAVRLIAGLIIQQIFLISQKGNINKKIILVIDEVSIVENESLVSILSESRKFNLSVVLAQQYLTQISSGLQRGVLSNVYNYFVFKTSDEDAKILSKNLDIEFPEEILREEKEKGISEEDLKRKLLVTLNPRECLVRLFAKGKFYSCFKAKTVTV